MNNPAQPTRQTSPDVCPTCAAYEDAIRYQAQRDYRRKMELWAEYERHRREVHHVLHIATTKGGGR